ncbi:MAG: hypothetical protein HYZ57_13845 [Acidobacteria bacterium]|nr:hypothetical protein [Acidobacteriota bacterium]
MDNTDAMMDVDRPRRDETGSGGMSRRLAESAHQAREKAAEFGRTAVDRIDLGRQSAAGTLQSAAETLRSSAPTGAGRMRELAHGAAQKLESGAAYMREHDVRTMARGAEQSMKRHPGVSLTAAAAVGFLLGVALRRK